MALYSGCNCDIGISIIVVQDENGSGRVQFLAPVPHYVIGCELQALVTPLPMRVVFRPA